MRRGTPPEYTEIITGAGVLKLIGNVCYVLGWLMVIVGAVALLAFVVSRANSDEATMTVALPLALTGLFGGSVYLAAGAILHMLGASGLALRDVAINSFRGGL